MPPLDAGFPIPGNAFATEPDFSLADVRHAIEAAPYHGRMEPVMVAVTRANVTSAGRRS